jgi:peptidyl-prolyl cis-trans isomerase A (cyclophilin A)
LASNSLMRLCLLLAGLLCSQGAIAASSASPVVVLETALGNIEIAVDAAHAPVTANNFLRYVDGGFYDGGEFNRTVRPDTEVRRDAPIQVIQARINSVRTKDEFPPIPIERTDVTGLKHLNGTVSMARDVTPTAPGPNTATSRFFICIGDQPSLNSDGNRSPDHQGFAAFGKVIKGFEVVEKIHDSPVDKSSSATSHSAKGQALEPPIKILRAYRK